MHDYVTWLLQLFRCTARLVVMIYDPKLQVLWVTW
jgi:hypothetical protein